MKNSLLELNMEERTRLIEVIQTFVYEELDIEIGSVKADRFIEFIKETIGKEIYNKGVEDSKLFITKRVEDVVIDMDQLVVL